MSEVDPDEYECRETGRLGRAREFSVAEDVDADYAVLFHLGYVGGSGDYNFGKYVFILVRIGSIY